MNEMNIRERVDRTLEEMLRLTAVSKGYLADRTLFTNLNDYEAANKAISDSQGFYVGVFGLGAVHARGEAARAGFYINRDNDLKEPQSGYGAYEYRAVEFDASGNPTKYNKYAKAKVIHGLEYEIRYLAFSPVADRVMEEIYFDTFQGAYFPLITRNDAGEYNLDGEKVFIEESYSEVLENRDVKELLRRVIVHDIKLEKDRLVAEGIPVHVVTNFTFNSEGSVEG